jgi:predicted RNase H-like nuclease (RuvC/YqgF family)
MMLRDYEKTRSDLINTRERNEELFREVDHLKAQNKDLDSRVIELSRDNECMR